MDLFYNDINEAIEDYKNGKLLIVVDDENRENEGDLVVASQFAKKNIINFMAKHARGLICVSLTEDRVNELGLPLMAKHNNALHNTAFTTSVEAKNGVTTGISAADRAKTINDLVNVEKNKYDFVTPGHMFPLIAKNGGTLVRAGHTEASVDLAKMAGLYPSGTICEIMNDDGTMSRLDDLLIFAEKFNLKILTIASLIEHRRKEKELINVVAQPEMPTEHGDFTIYAINDFEGNTHIALLSKNIDTSKTVNVRIHSECFTGDILGSLRCDCGSQLHKAMDYISENEGILVYMRQEGRGIGLANKLKAYELQDQGFDTVEANHKLGFESDLRDYGIGAQILKHFGINKINLLTNNPKKICGLEGYDIEIENRIPIEIEPNKCNFKYLKTKKDKMGHILKKL